MELTEDQIRHASFWYWRPEDDFPPSPITYPDEYAGEERLCIACTQTGTSDHAQKKLVQCWCEALPGMPGVRYLWFVSRVNQHLLDAVCAMRQLEGLYVKWSSVKSIEPLVNLTSLRHLHMGSSTAVESAEPLSHMTSLITLDVENVKKMDRLDPIGRLKQLEGLGIEGSVWTTQVVDTLAPLQDLAHLRYLSLANLRSRDCSLKPLASLQELVSFHCALWWPEPELEFLRGRLRNVKYGNLIGQLGELAKGAL